MFSELSKYIKCKQEYDIKQIKATQVKELQHAADSDQSLDNEFCPPPLSRRTFVQSVSLGSGGKKCQTLKQSGHKNSRKKVLELPSTEKVLVTLKSKSSLCIA